MLKLGCVLFYVENKTYFHCTTTQYKDNLNVINSGKELYIVFAY